MDLHHAQGSIGPNHYSSDLSLREELRQGQWLTRTTTDVPSLCIDGRPVAGGQNPTPAPRSAGGTVGLWVAENLAATPGTPLKPVDDLTGRLGESLLPIGVHTGPAHGGNNSGCGAADNLGLVLSMLTAKEEAIADLVSAWGFDPSLIDEEMRARAEEIIAAGFAGPDLIESVALHPAAEVIDLRGDHLESVAVVNLRPRTTTDTANLITHYSPAPQLFGVDAWSFRDVAQFISDSVSAAIPAQRIAAALAAFNAAALLVLASPDFPTVLIEQD